jgi:hypothetical protein
MTQFPGLVAGLAGEQGLPETVAFGDADAGVGDAQAGQESTDLGAGQSGVGSAEDVGGNCEVISAPGARGGRRRPRGHGLPWPLPGRTLLPDDQDRPGRPVFHRLRDSFEAHLTIAFAALAVSREPKPAPGCRPTRS